MKESQSSCSAANNSPKKCLVKAERLTKNRFCFQPIEKINQVDKTRETFCKSDQRPNEIIENEPGNDVSSFTYHVFVWLCFYWIFVQDCPSRCNSVASSTDSMTEQLKSVSVTAEPTDSLTYYQSLIDDFDSLKDLVVLLCEVDCNFN
jgi:hypothetical protein